MQEATQTGHVLVVLDQQNCEQLLRRDQTSKPAVAADHGKAGFTPRCTACHAACS